MNTLTLTSNNTDLKAILILDIKKQKGLIKHSINNKTINYFSYNKLDHIIQLEKPMKLENMNEFTEEVITEINNMIYYFHQVNINYNNKTLSYNKLNFDIEELLKDFIFSN